MRRLATLLAAAALVATGACSTGFSPGPTLAPALSNTEINQADASMRDFGERYFSAWPISDAVAPQLADDATFTDPTSGDALAGKASVTRMVGVMEIGFPDLDYRVNGVFVSADGALYELEADGLWPPFVPTPANHPPVGEIQATRVEGDLLKTTELAFPVSDLEMFPLGCFADHGCSDQYEMLVSDYVSAWSSGDEGKIAALYRDDAVFTDSLLGINVTGAREIGRLGQTRFGPATGVRDRGPWPVRADRHLQDALLGGSESGGDHRGRYSLPRHHDHRRPGGQPGELRAPALRDVHAPGPRRGS